MNCAKCEYCGDLEPQDFDYIKNGLWVCDCEESNKNPPTGVVERVLAQIEAMGEWT